MVERRLTGMIAAAAVLMMLFIVWDLFRPAPRSGGAVDHDAPLDSHIVLVPVSSAPPTPPPAAASSRAGGAAVPAAAPQPGPGADRASEPGYIELLARSETRRRIRASAGSTYLNEMLAGSSDSMLRRWDNRSVSPIRVWFAPTNAANYRPAFREAIRRAFGEWTGAGVPVRFDFDADSTQAEVVVRWRIQFEIERTGQTDLTWDENGHVQSAIITLATFDPKGRPMEDDDVRVVALHEIGHLLGLDHSTDSTDIMYPTAKVRGLSNRDVRTVMLLYQLSPGSLR